jgi:hypothetical protein
MRAQLKKSILALLAVIVLIGATLALPTVIVLVGVACGGGGGGRDC